nr:hypothetical protein [Bacteroidota bacterium]
MGQTGLTVFIVLAAIIFFLFIAGLFIFIFQYRKRKIIFEKEKQLIALESILKGQEEERTRMAKDLHDSLGGMLSGIKLNLSSLKGNIMLDEKDSSLFYKSILQLDNAIAEMRRVAHNMMPEALLRLGLAEAMQDYCDSINESRMVKMKYTQLGITNPIEKSMEVTLIALYRSFRIMLLNMHRPKIF